MSGTEQMPSSKFNVPSPLLTNDKKPFTPALIVIDMQNDFVSGTLPVPGGSTIVPKINELIDLPFALKVATRDFHPTDHVSFAQTHQKDLFSTKTIFHPEDAEEALGVEQTLWPVHCVAQTDGADFVPGLKTTAFDAVIHKGTHPGIESYSAFRDIWNRTETELPALLVKKGITDLYFVGLAGDYCVKCSATHSMDYGYKTWLVRDAIKSISEDETPLQALEMKGAKLVTTGELCRLLGTGAPIESS